jgi:hypothetical protein
MAFTVEYTQPQRWDHFSFYTSGGVDGNISESVAPNYLFRFDEIRVHLSVAFASVANFTVRLSSIKGSAYNLMLISQAMLSVKDLVWQADQAMYFNSDDQLIIELPMTSGTNTVGIDVQGWAVQS